MPTLAQILDDITASVPDEAWAHGPPDLSDGPKKMIATRDRRIAELEARLSALIAKAILPADGADEVTVAGVRWVRVPAETTVRFERN